MAMGTEPTPIELRPRFSLGNEDNWMLCLRQLRAAKVPQGLINKFSFEFGAANQQATHTGRAIETAAENCGWSVHWVN